LAKASDSTATTGSEPPQPHLKREIGLLDLTLFYVVSGLSLRWIATAAASGPSSLVVWIFAWIGFFLPLAASVLELSSRYPQEGGLYVWAQQCFGDFAGFIAAWTYAMSNLPYFPAVLYFAAGSALFVGGSRGSLLALSNESGYFMTFSLVALGGITLLNIRGVKPGKWLNNAGALGMFLPILVLIVLGCQGRSKTRPLGRSKSRPVVASSGCWVCGVEGPLERSGRGPSTPRRVRRMGSVFCGSV